MGVTYKFSIFYGHRMRCAWGVRGVLVGSPSKARCYERNETPKKSQIMSIIVEGAVAAVAGATGKAWTFAKMACVCAGERSWALGLELEAWLRLEPALGSG